MQVNLTKGVMTVGFWTLLSRILGMVREILLSALIGAGPLLDAVSYTHLTLPTILLV